MTSFLLFVIYLFGLVFYFYCWRGKEKGGGFQWPQTPINGITNVKKEWRHLSCDMWVVWSKHDTSHQSALGISLCIFNQHGNGKKIWRSANYTVNFSLLFSCFTPCPAQVAPILKPTTNHLCWWPHKLFSLFFSFVCIHRNVADHLNYKWPAVRVRRVVDEKMTSLIRRWRIPLCYGVNRVKKKKRSLSNSKSIAHSFSLKIKKLLLYGQNRQAINRLVASVLFTKEKHHLNLWWFFLLFFLFCFGQSLFSFQPSG